MNLNKEVITDELYLFADRGAIKTFITLFRAHNAENKHFYINKID